MNKESSQKYMDRYRRVAGDGGFVIPCIMNHTAKKPAMAQMLELRIGLEAVAPT